MFEFCSNNISGFHGVNENHKRFKLKKQESINKKLYKNCKWRLLMKNKKPVLIGIFGSLILLLIYFGILTIANSFSHAIAQFIEMGYWIVALVAGFGIQVGLYSYIRTSMHAKTAIASTEIAATGGISTGSMIACCLHHLTDVLPIIGLSAAVFLTEYQVLFMIVGILSNFVGITFMLGIIQEHKLFNIKKGSFKNLFKYNMKGVRNKTILLSIIIFFISLSLTMFKSPTESSTLPIDLVSEGGTVGQTISLQTMTNDEGRVTFDVTPIDFSYEEPVSFEIDINTHTGSLNFDLTEITVLEDDTGNKILPLDWDGSAPGGHHRRGILSFPKLNGQTKSMKLIIKDVYDIPERVFIWDLE